MTTLAEAKTLIGQYVTFEGIEPLTGERSAGSGWLWRVDVDPDGRAWAVTDEGLGFDLAHHTLTPTEPPISERVPFDVKQWDEMYGGPR